MLPSSCETSTTPLNFPRPQSGRRLWGNVGATGRANTVAFARFLQANRGFTRYRLGVAGELLGKVLLGSDWVLGQWKYKRAWGKGSLMVISVASACWARLPRSLKFIFDVSGEVGNFTSNELSRTNLIIMANQSVIIVWVLVSSMSGCVLRKRC